MNGSCPRRAPPEEPPTLEDESAIDTDLTCRGTFAPVASAVSGKSVSSEATVGHSAFHEAIVVTHPPLPPFCLRAAVGVKNHVVEGFSVIQLTDGHRKELDVAAKIVTVAHQ